MKRLKTVLLLLMLSFCIQITAAPGTVNAAGATVKKTGLVKQNGKYFYYQKGKKLKSQWKTVTVKGKKYRYYFGKDGAAYAGKVKYGEKVPTVKKIGKATYAFDCNGRMLKGIQVINQKFYVFSANSGKLDTKKTTALRKASAYEADAAKLKKLLKKYGAKLKKTEYYGFGCYGDGEDGMMIWSNFQVSVFKYSGGKVVVLGVYPKE